MPLSQYNYGLPCEVCTVTVGIMHCFFSIPNLPAVMPEVHSFQCRVFCAQSCWRGCS